MRNRFHGVGPALVTPFKEDLSIDFDAYKKLLEDTAERVDYWVVQGTTGESATTTLKEKKEILQFSKDHNAKNLPIVFGIGGNNTSAVVESIGEFDLNGVDALLSASPHYNKPSQEGIYQHFLKVAEASPVPIILYNVPGRTASKMSADTILRLAEHENIIGVKEASGDLEQCMHIMANKPEDFLLISGDDLLTAPMIALGGDGVISVMANAFPNVFCDMVHSALDGKFDQSNKALHQLLEINPYLYAESNPVGVKHAMQVLGKSLHHVRLPLLPASLSLQKEIENQVKKYNLR